MAESIAARDKNVNVQVENEDLFEVKRIKKVYSKGSSDYEIEEISILREIKEKPKSVNFHKIGGGRVFVNEGFTKTISVFDSNLR